MHIFPIILTSTVFFILSVMGAPAAVVEQNTRANGHAKPPDKKTEERGRYVIQIAGCNDCHTAGYAEAAGKIPEKGWLKGDTIAGGEALGAQPTRAIYDSTCRTSRKTDGSRSHAPSSFVRPCHGSFFA